MLVEVEAETLQIVLGTDGDLKFRVAARWKRGDQTLGMYFGKRAMKTQEDFELSDFLEDGRVINTASGHIDKACDVCNRYWNRRLCLEEEEKERIARKMISYPSEAKGQVKAQQKNLDDGKSQNLGAGDRVALAAGGPASLHLSLCPWAQVSHMVGSHSDV